MKRIIVAIFILSSFAGCKKAAVQPVKEENIVFDVNTALSSISTSTTFAFQVTLKSKMPANGIRIDVTAIDESSGTAILPQATGITSTNVLNNVSVQNLPRQKWVEAMVKVTSISTSTNSASSRFRVIYK